MLSSCKWSLPLLLTASFAAHACGPAGNLVTNCNFSVDISGYTAQKGGDVISHEPAAGNQAPGAMRVRDASADSDNEAEAESCVNLTTSRDYRLSASFRAVLAAETCLLGWDEFVSPNCTQPNGTFVASAGVSVNSQNYTAVNALLSASPAARSVELVILCAAGSGEPQFLVDDVALIPATLLRNGFEAP